MLDRIKKEAIQGKGLLKFFGLKATGQALGMIAPLVIARFFSVEVFGRYSLAKMIVFLFVAFFISSIQVPFVVYGGKERAETGKINKTFTIQCFFLAVSLVLFLVLVLLTEKYIMAFAEISRENVFFLYLAFLGLSTKSFLSNLFLATNQRTQHASIEFVFGFCSLLLIIVFRLLDWLNLNSIFLIYLISAVVAILLLIRRVEFKKLMPFVWDHRCFRDNFNFTKWVILGSSSIYLINWGDNLVLRLYVEMDAIGIYNFAYQMFKGMIMLTFVLCHYFMPFASSKIKDAQAIRAYLRHKRPKAFLLGLVPIVVLFISAPYLAELFYAGAYDRSVGILRLLLIACVPALYTGFYSPIFFALERYRFTQFVEAGQAVVNVLLNVILVPSMGIRGAAIATVIAYFLRAVIFEVYYRKKVKQLFYE